ncbi:MAG: two-component system sensor histidine kinase NtrB [Syntrophothermus sp.]
MNFKDYYIEFKRRLNINPRLLILFALTFGIILVAVTAFDIYQSYVNIYRTKTEEAAALLRSVRTAGENAYISSMELESVVTDKLINNAFLVSRMDEKGNLDEALLNKIAITNRLSHIYIFNGSGIPELKNSNRRYQEMELFKTFGREIDSINSGRYDYYTAGSIPEINAGSQLLVLHKRGGNRPGIIAVTVEENYIPEFRKKIGVGKLFQQIAEGKDIEYIVIQDTAGIITASRGLENISSLDSDKFLYTAVTSGKIATRETEFNGQAVFEAVQAFQPGGDMSLIRIGISLESVRSLIKWTVVRSILISVLLLMVGVVVIIYIARNKSYSVLENQYRRIQDYTGNILDNMSDSVFVTDSSGKVLLLNKAAENLLGMKAEAAAGLHYTRLLGGEENLISRTLQTMEPVSYMENSIIRQDRSEIIAGGSSSIIWDEEGKSDAVIAVLRDVTQMRLFEENKKRHEKLSAMGELAAGVAHEIKNPLNLISITAQRLVKEFEPLNDAEEYGQLIRGMRQEINRVTEIINQFLRFARPPVLIKTKISISDVLEDAARLFESAAAERCINLAVAADETEIMADASQLRQVMVNLIQNAFDAVEDNGKVWVTASGKNNKLLIAVFDNGMGIPQENLKKIFDIYFTTKTSGNGLGLSIVNQIINAHNGTIKAESSLKSGTIFTIELPEK